MSRQPVLRPPAARGSMSMATAGDDRLVLRAAAFFTVAVLLHGADHARRGVDTIGREIFWLGVAAMVLEVGVVVLACQRHRLAPLAAAVAGFSLTAGYVAVHFLPARSWASDSLTSGVDVSPLSWGAASLEVVAATVLGIVGAVVLRRRGGLTSAAARPKVESDHRRPPAAHPVALAMIVGNLVLLAVSLAQLA